MANQKIRKSGNTLTSVVITVLLCIGIFFGTYLYVSENVRDAGFSLDSKYTNTYHNLNDSSERLHGDIVKIKDNLQNVTEAENTWQVAWNGLKGLGNTIKLSLNFVATTLKTWTSLLGFASEFIPGWALGLIFTALIGFLVFLVIKVMKGEPNM